MQVGDLTQNALSAEDTTATAFLNGLGSTWYAALGNHDLYNSRTGDQWASDYGYADQNYVVDFASFRLIVLGDDTIGDNVEGDQGTMTLSEASLIWLDARLTDDPAVPCAIVFHAPLYNTVLGDTATNYTSVAPEWAYAHDDAAIRAVLADNANAIAWISGHTHSAIDMPDLVKAETVGSHVLAAINASSIYYTGKSAAAGGRICTLFVTIGDGVVEVRCRDHGLQEWVTIDGAYVVTVPVG